VVHPERFSQPGMRISDGPGLRNVRKNAQGIPFRQMVKTSQRGALPRDEPVEQHRFAPF